VAKRGNWVFNPNSGGKPIPELVQRRTDARLRSYAESTTPDGMADSRFGSAASSVMSTRTRNLRSPVQTGRQPTGRRHARSTWSVCVIRPSTCVGCGNAGMRNIWGFAFFAYSSDKYELSVFPLGQFFGPPEDAFEVSANVHLQ